MTVIKHNSLGEAFTRFASGIKEVVSDKRVVITSNMEGLQNMTVGALEAFLPIYAVTVANLSTFQAGLLWGVQVIATILSKPIMGKTSDRLGRTPLIYIGMYPVRPLLCHPSTARLLSAQSGSPGLRPRRDPGDLIAGGADYRHLQGEALWRRHGHLRHHL